MTSKSRGSRALPYVLIGAAFVATVAYVLTVLPHGAGRSAQTPPSPEPVPHSDGLSDSFEGYRMVPVSLPDKRGKAVPVSFRLLGPDGAALSYLRIVQARPVHLYLIRQDISGYQHLHPAIDGDDVWSVPIDLDDGGSYRLYAEFMPEGWRGAATGDPVILGLAFVVAGDTKLAPLPAPAASSVAGPFTVERVDGTSHLHVSRATLLRFQIPGATLEPYLGALAHMSAFEVRTQGLIHLHAASNELAFHAQFPNRGEYRLYIEFQAAGAVHQAAFTVFVT